MSGEQCSKRIKLRLVHHSHARCTTMRCAQHYCVARGLCITCFTLIQLSQWTSGRSYVRNHRLARRRLASRVSIMPYIHSMVDRSCARGTSHDMHPLRPSDFTSYAALHPHALACLGFNEKQKGKCVDKNKHNVVLFLEFNNPYIV